MAAETNDLVYGGGTSGFSVQYGKPLTNLSATLNVADWVTEKGAALEASDFAQVLRLPAGSLLIAATVTITDGFDGTSTIDVGWAESATHDVIVDGANPATETVCARGTNGLVLQGVPFTSSDTIDVKIASLSSAPTTGELRIDALVMSIGSTVQD